MTGWVCSCLSVNHVTHSGRQRSEFFYSQQAKTQKEERTVKKRTTSVILAAVFASALLLGSLHAAETEPGQGAETESGQAAETAQLIDAIYVQEWNDDTYDLCEQAKASWDALSDEEKESVVGEYADPDYFGRDTGDASKDDPLNADGIGENEILVVSFGTSFNDSRVEDIKGVEDAIAAAYPDWSVRRAFTAQIILNHIYARDGEKIDNIEQALERAVENGVKNLVIQPTHLMHGAEYDEIITALEAYQDQFETAAVAEPLLGEVGTDIADINEDKQIVAEAVTKEAVRAAGYDSLESAAQDGTAFVLMGHGTAHTAKVSYSQMASQMKALHYDNVFIGTVEGEPEETSCEHVIEEVKNAGYTKVVLRPLMVVAGDHANNDMAGDEDDSWKSMFTASGAFDSIDCQVEGLGRIEAVKDLYVSHTSAAIEEPEHAEAPETESEAVSAALPDGEYDVIFQTDSNMFRINEALHDTARLTVKDGKMTVHISLASQNIVNLFPGIAEDAAKEGAKLLEPTRDEVTYSDGMTETVNGFDVPVPALDTEFDLALIGTKGKWYDHKVMVSSPE